MIDINEELEKINKAKFFSNMGLFDFYDENVIFIENVEKVFVTPSDNEFKGYYKNTEWLPTSPTQDDPFYEKQNNPKDLIEIRMKINKAVMDATKELDKSKFISKPHNFHHAARNAICYAFRQYISEKYLDLGSKWEEIVKIYYAGHWPVGISKEKLIVI
ncbi:hypothetical protein [Xenorhabdus bovienii]|uniref:Uncharacterized protein n=2 Tax=Xenorhabdus bovienii TaxID=40576 RepID=A0A077QRR0_XENBV|nr:hypothetical protein [Xenorhabdus bovienii]CDH07374.1 conserved hypothetical protein [Xenorhabdus bovienii str. oregonense]CDH35246.1 conserved hypothetical protein [Xenorhabdus bovienii str. Intermedium]